MYYVMRASVPSLHRESTDSLDLIASSKNVCINRHFSMGIISQRS